MTEKQSTAHKQRMRHVVQMTIDALPLLRKRLLCIDSVQVEHSMPISHIQAMALIRDCGKLSATDLSRRLGIAKPNITPLVNRLIEEGYVRRERSAQDKRVIHIALEQRGCAKLDEIFYSIIDENDEWVGKELSQKQWKVLEASLNNILRVFGEERRDLEMFAFAEAMSMKESV